MEHCKKLVLLPHEALTKLHEKPATRTSGDVMNDLDQEMSNILKQRAADSEKWKLYEQALQKYLYFVNEQKKPTALFFPETNTRENEIEMGPSQNTILKEKLVALIPQKFKTAASTLYDHLSTPEAKSLISWDTSGTASVGGETFTSIIDLISDAVRTRKTPKISRWQTFVSVLKSLHTPLDIIGNSTYLRALQAQEGEGITENHVSFTKTNSQTSNKRKKVTGARNPTKTKKNKFNRPVVVQKTKWKRWT